MEHAFAAESRAAPSPSPEQPPASDFADFLFGVPDTAPSPSATPTNISAPIYDAYILMTGASPRLLAILGVRWEYSAPITELYGRLVNLDVARNFASAAPLVARSPAR